MRKVTINPITLVAILSITLLFTISSQSIVYGQMSDQASPSLPPWIKNNFKWYSEGVISEGEVLNAIKHLADNNIIRLNPQDPISQSMQDFRNNPQLMQNWMNPMMNDPELRQQMMNYWNQHMMWNPQHMQGWLGPMMDDPNLRQQMYDSMYGHNPFMQSMMADPQFQNMWGGHMMGRGMMGPGMMGGYQSSTTPIPSGEDSQIRTFDISMEEVEFMAEVVTQDGNLEFATVELHVWEPDLIIVNQGDTVVLNISNPRKHAHTFSIPDFGLNTKILEPREGVDSVTFIADTPGVFTFYCGLPYNPDKLYCDPDHSMMTGTLIVLE